MAISVSRYEKVRDCIIDAWSTTWPAVSGCGTRTEYYSATSYLCPSGAEQVWYEPERVNEVQDRRKMNGKTSGRKYPYIHTPRLVSRVITRQFVAKRVCGGSSGLRPYRQFGSVERVGGYCTPVVSRVDDLGSQYPLWIENYTGFTGNDNVLYAIDTSEITAAKTSVENEAAISALSSYDLLTEIAEAREIPGAVRSASEGLYNILKKLARDFDPKTLRRASRFRPRDLLRHADRVFRTLGSTWMGYRYAVMPLVYSYRDVLKTAQRGVNNTTRNAKVIVPKRTATGVPSSTTDYKWSYDEGSVVVRANIFQHFEWETLAKYSGVGFNPLVTAWELIPYSFVFDWFVNMGDYITRTTAIPCNDGFAGSVSIRSKYTRKTYIHFKSDNQSVTIWNYIPTNWWGSTPPNPPSIPIPRPEESQMIQSIETDAYERNPMFALNAARLQFNPSLNWKRLLDSAVLSSNLLKTLVKKVFK